MKKLLLLATMTMSLSPIVVFAGRSDQEIQDEIKSLEAQIEELKTGLEESKLSGKQFKDMDLTEAINNILTLNCSASSHDPRVLKNPEGSSTREDVEAIFGTADGDIVNEGEEGDDEHLTLLWENPRNNTKLSAYFLDEHLIRIEVLDLNSKGIKESDLGQIKEDGSMELEQVLDQLGTPYTFSKGKKGSLDTLLLDWKKEDSDGYYYVSFKDGVVVHVDK